MKKPPLIITIFFGIAVLGMVARLVILTQQKRATSETFVSQEQNLNAPSLQLRGEISSFASAKQDISDISALSVGATHLLALNKEGKLLTLGDNAKGQLGLFSKVKIPLELRPHEFDTKLIGLASGSLHSLLLSEQGEVFASGYNYSGQLGFGDNKQVKEFKKIPSLKNIIKIQAGQRISGALSSNGNLYLWGASCSESKKRIAESASNIEEITKNIGYFDGVAIGNFSGPEHELALGLSECVAEDLTGVVSSEPRRYTFGDDLDTFSIGYGHVLVLTQEGDVYSMGCNLYGQLGHNGNDGFNLVVFQDSQKIKQLSAGYRHSLALDEGGSVWAWGSNYHKQVSHLSEELKLNKPLKITGLPVITKVVAAYDFSLALDQEGNVWAWGQNEFRQLVDSDEIDIQIPQIIASNIQDIGAEANSLYLIPKADN